MRLASKAALLLSPDLRAVARDLRAVRGLLRDGHAQLIGQGATVPRPLVEAHEKVLDVLDVLEGRDPNRG